MHLPFGLVGDCHKEGRNVNLHLLIFSGGILCEVRIIEGNKQKRQSQMTLPLIQKKRITVQDGRRDFNAVISLNFLCLVNIGLRYLAFFSSFSSFSFFMGSPF